MLQKQDVEARGPQGGTGVWGDRVREGETVRMRGLCLLLSSVPLQLYGSPWLGSDSEGEEEGGRPCLDEETAGLAGV